MAALELISDHPTHKVYKDDIFMLKGVRISFPHLDKPFAGKDDNGKEGKPKFGVVSMMDKNTQKAAALAVSAGIKRMLEAKKATVAKDKRCLRDGDDLDRDEYLGHYILSAREDRRPSLRDRRGVTITPEEAADMMYGGCYCNVLIRLWYQDGQTVGKGFGKRVNAGLIGVQFVRDGDPFGEGRINDDDAWDPVDGEDDDVFGSEDDDL